MSFRARLTLFFVLIVVVPMTSLAVLVFGLVADNEAGKSDQRLAARTAAAEGLRDTALRRADDAVEDIGRDRAFAAALQAGDRRALKRRAAALLRLRGAKRIVIARGDVAVLDVGARSAVFPATRRLQDALGRDFGALQVSVQGPQDYVVAIKEATDIDAVIERDGRVLAATRDDALQLPRKDYERRSFDGRGFFGAQVRVTVVEPRASLRQDVRNARLAVAGILLLLFLVAVVCSVLVSRSLQRQVMEFLQAARRIGAGDFETRVPVSGRDEFAALGTEFNAMAAQLRERLDELSHERARLQHAMRRIGEAFAANLDRDALLEIVVETAIDGVAADGGRAVARARAGEPMRRVASRGDDPALDGALAAAEAQVLETGGVAGAAVDGAVALAHPLPAPDGESPAGVVAVARRERPFTDGERELFEYLAAQAAISVENVGLHETVERQAVTDELTGLANRRRFDEALSDEAERSRRFDQPVGLLLLDIDDFKRVNDVHGHQQGDVVLQEVARVLRDSCREIDEPARYGGEELAAVLPGTDLEGATNLAERVRSGIEALRVPRLDAGGDALRITASFGVATLPACAEDAASLVAAADEALYRAKRSGKNRVARASGVRRVS